MVDLQRNDVKDKGGLQSRHRQAPSECVIKEPLSGKRTALAAVLPLSICMMMGTVHVNAKPVFSLGYAGSYDSNPSLVSTGEESNTTQSLFGAITGQTQGARLNTVTDIRLGYEDGDKTNSRLIGNGGFNADLSIRPNRLHWTLRDSLSHTLVDFLESSTNPSNSDLRNTFATGPRISYELTPRNKVSVTGEFIRTSHYETDANDTQDWVGTADFEHAISETAVSGLAYSYRDSELVNAASSHSQIENANLYFDINRLRHQLHLEAGYGRDISLDYETGTGSVTWTYKFNSRFAMTLSSARTLTTASAEADQNFITQLNQFNFISRGCQLGAISGPSCIRANRLNNSNHLINGFFLDDPALAQKIFADSNGSLEQDVSNIVFSWMPKSYSSYSLNIFTSDQEEVLEESLVGIVDPDEDKAEGVSISANFTLSERLAYGLSLLYSDRTSTTYDQITGSETVTGFQEEILTGMLSYKLRPKLETQFELHYSNADRDSSVAGTDPGGDGYGGLFSIIWTL